MRTGAEDCEELIIVVASVWQIGESNQPYYLDGWKPQHLSWAQPTLALLLPLCRKRDFCQYHLQCLQQCLPFFGKASSARAQRVIMQNCHCLHQGPVAAGCWAPLITICTCFLVHPGYGGAAQEITGRILSCIPLYLQFLGFSIINIQMKYSIPWIFITPVLDNNDSSD